MTHLLNRHNKNQYNQMITKQTQHIKNFELPKHINKSMKIRPKTMFDNRRWLRAHQNYSTRHAIDKRFESKVKRYIKSKDESPYTQDVHIHDVRLSTFPLIIKFVT